MMDLYMKDNLKMIIKMGKDNGKVINNHTKVNLKTIKWMAQVNLYMKMEWDIKENSRIMSHMVKANFTIKVKIKHLWEVYGLMVKI